MERGLKMIAASIVVLAGAVVFAAAGITLAVAGIGPRTNYDGQTFAGWAIFGGIVLVAIGFFLMFRRETSRSSSQSAEETFDT